MENKSLDVLIQALIQEKKDLKIIDCWNYYFEKVKTYCRTQTQERYLKDFKPFKKFMDDNSIIYTNQLNENIINKFINHSKHNSKNITINQKINNFKYALNYCVKMKYLNSNPLDFFKKLPEDQFKGKVLDKDEINKLIHFIETYNLNKTKIKFKAAIMLSMDAGLRPNEIVNIKLDDLNLKQNEIQLSYTKAHENRKIFITDKTKKAIIEYIDIALPTKFIFYSKTSKLKHEDARFLSRHLNKIKKELNISDLTVYTLRRSFATILIKENYNINEVMILMGHTNMRTTQKYFNQNLDELKNKHINKSITNTINA